MIVYIIFIFFIITLSIIFDGYDNNSRNKNIAYVIVCIFTILLMGLRNGVGGDTQAYIESFDYVPINPVEYKNYIWDMMVLDGFMPGWSILNLFCKKIFDSFYAVQLIQSAIVNICIFYIFKKYTKHIFLCVLIYGLSGQIFNFNTEVMREGIAIAIGSFGMYQYLRGHKLLFYIFLSISLTFHISAIILLLFPFARIRQINVRTLLCAFIVSFLIWLTSDFLFYTMIQHITGNSAITYKIISYSDLQSNIFGFLMNSIRYFVTQIGIMFFAKGFVDDNNKIYYDYTYFVSFSLIIIILTCAVPGLRRFINYTIILFIIMMAEYLFNLKKQLVYFPVVKLSVLISFIFFTTQFYFQYWPQNERYHYEFFVPYTSIFDKYIDNTYRISMHSEAVHSKEIDSKNSRSF